MRVSILNLIILLGFSPVFMGCPSDSDFNPQGTWKFDVRDEAVLKAGFTDDTTAENKSYKMITNDPSAWLSTLSLQIAYDDASDPASIFFVGRAGLGKIPFIDDSTAEKLYGPTEFQPTPGCNIIQFSYLAFTFDEKGKAAAFSEDTTWVFENLSDPTDEESCTELFREYRSKYLTYGAEGILDPVIKAFFIGGVLTPDDVLNTKSLQMIIKGDGTKQSENIETSAAKKSTSQSVIPRFIQLKNPTAIGNLLY